MFAESDENLDWNVLRLWSLIYNLWFLHDFTIDLLFVNIDYNQHLIWLTFSSGTNKQTNKNEWNSLTRDKFISLF